MYVERNSEGRSRNHCCRGKADVFSILSVCMFVCVCVCVYIALVIKHAKRVRRIVFSVWLHHIFPDYLINGMISEKKFY